jgi:hypothetical protein
LNIFIVVCKSFHVHVRLVLEWSFDCFWHLNFLTISIVQVMILFSRGCVLIDIFIWCMFGGSRPLIVASGDFRHVNVGF